MNLQQDVITLTQMNEMLMDLIDANGQAIGGLMTSVGDNSTAIGNLGTTVGENMDKIEALEEKTGLNMMGLMNLSTEVDTLQEEVELLEDAALIESYYEINESGEQVPMQPFYVLVDPFCIEGSTVLVFQLSVTLSALFEG